MIFIDADEEGPGVRLKANQARPVMSMASRADSTTARFDRRIYESWVSLIIPGRRGAGTIHGDIDSN